jgi:capsular exopolysaccharide synthesis family protein
MAETEYEIQQEENGLNIKRYLFKIFINWPLFIVAMVVSFSVAYLYIRYACEPLYKAQATIMVNVDPKGAESVMPLLGRSITRSNMENEISTLRSFSLTQKTLSELDLLVTYKISGRVKETIIFNPFFKVILDTTKENSTYSPVKLTFLENNKILVEIDDAQSTKKKISFDEPFENKNFHFTIKKINDYDHKNINDAGQYSFFINNIVKLTSIYQKKLEITSDEKKGSLLTLSTSGPIPDQEVIYLNKLCEVYLRNGLEEKNQASINAIQFIDVQLSIISDSLKKTELKLQAFRVNNKIFDILQEEKISSSRLLELQQQKYENELKLKYCAYLRDYLSKRADFKDIMAPSSIGIADPLFIATISELIALNNEKKVAILSINENNPSIKKLDQKIENTKKTLEESLNEIENSTRFSNKLSDEAIRKEEDKLFSLPPTEREYLTIKREYDINNNIFSFLLQKRAESGIVKASNLADNKIIDIARPENTVQISPNRSKIYSTALLLAVVIPIAIILFMEFMNNKIVDIKDLSRLKKSNLLGTIGHNNRESDIPVFEFPKSALAESFRGLRANLQYLMPEKNENTILITSTISGEGKTFCAINLAAILAMSNKKTLLMSLDLRKPKLHRYFNISNEKGISNYLIHQASKEEIIIPTNINNLYLAPSGPVPPNPAELIDTDSMGTLIKQLKQEFDFIIIDSPPIAIVTDAILLSKHSDLSIYVVRQNLSSKEVLHLIDELAEKKQLKHLNVIVNDVKVPGYYGYSSRYGNRYGYSYHYGYGYGYYSYGNEYYGEDAPTKGIKQRLKKWLGT